MPALAYAREISADQLDAKSYARSRSHKTGQPEPANAPAHCSDVDMLYVEVGNASAITHL